MRKAYIKQTLSSMAMLLMALCVCVSCIKDNNTVELSPECAIVSFSVGNITSSVVTKKYDKDGNATDTVVSRTISGSDIFFNIDQVHGRIYNVDSLPNWVDLSHIIPAFSSYGHVLGKIKKDDDLYYLLTSGVDSVDCSKSVELICIATDGMSSKHYTLDIYKHVDATDTLEWKAVESNLNIAGQSKVYCTDNKVFAFAKNDEGKSVVTFVEGTVEASSSQPVYDAAQWSAPCVMPVDWASVVLYNEMFYGLGADGYIYRAAPEQLATTWTKASDLKVERLLAADKYYLYAYDGNAIIGSSNLQEWSVQGMSNLDMLPDACVNFYSYASNTNDDIQVAVMTGLCSKNMNNGVAWYKTSSQDSNINQFWSYIEVTDDNPYGLPRLEHLSVTRYHNALYAIGSASGKYEFLYRSDDNGITWHPLTKMYPVPSDLHAINGAASIATVGNSLWIIQENGKIWQGSIR